LAGAHPEVAATRPPSGSTPSTRTKRAEARRSYVV
jgi:hypothetical protein